jgi:hypothetical protein
MVRIPLKPEDLKQYVEKNIGDFHKSRLDNLHKLKLNEILSRKNPYLFKAKNILIATDLVKTLLDAYLSSQEETLFGTFLEGLAIYVSGVIYNGKKSSGVGIDLEFDKEGKHYIIAIKSGPNWGNSQQISRMKDNFIQAKRILRTNKSGVEVIAINGCCYGKESKPDKGEYYKYCGQKFWEFISGDKNFYTSIIEPLGYKAKEKNQQFSEEYATIINLFSIEFSKEFCSNGNIDWNKLVAFNSAMAN